MLDARYISENPERVRKAIRDKNERRDDIDEICRLYKKRKAIQAEIDRLRHEVKELSKKFAQSKKEGKENPTLMDKSRAAGDKSKQLEEEQRDLDGRLQELLAWVPNIPAEGVPIGTDPSGNKIVDEKGEKRKFSFKPKPHWELATDLDLVDFERAPRVSAANFLLFKKLGARLERALINFMLDLHIKQHGYEEIWPPYLAGRGPMFGSAQIPKLEGDMYRIAEDGMFLIPTGEVPLTSLHTGEILNHAELPKYYTAYTACFRREAGAYGRETRGMIRIHQFDKVELFKITRPRESSEELERLLGDAKKVLELLEIPYRVVLLCSGDTSFASSKTYDIEIWAPGIERWLEVSSCSNFGDFQARRTNLRFRDEKKKVNYVHTLNGSGVALPRTVIALLENHQQEDGSVVIPKPLQPFFDGIEVIKK